MKRFALVLLLTTSALAQNDQPYTDAIRKFTTEPRFMTELVDHLPASETVPSPLEFNGYIAGAEGKLTYAADVHRYMRALEAASPRVKVFSIGTTEERSEERRVGKDCRSRWSARAEEENIAQTCSLSCWSGA